jgi:hypothetical protein
MPQIVNSGGPVLSAPKIVALTFDADPSASAIQEYISRFLGAKSYFRTATEYGVGPIASASTLRLDEPPDINVESWLAKKIGEGANDAGVADGGIPFPQPDSNTAYVVFYPDSVTPCSAYHYDFVRPGGVPVPYAVICGSSPYLFSSAAHEIFETVTDPFPRSRPAFLVPGADQAGWGAAIVNPGTGEVADMCFGSSLTPQLADLPYSQPRIWSNQQAAAGHDPCQPEGISPYFKFRASIDRHDPRRRSADEGSKNPRG